MRTLETRETQRRLIEHIMKEYDQQSFRNPVARFLVLNLMEDGLSELSDKQLYETAHKWFPEVFPK